MLCGGGFPNKIKLRQRARRAKFQPAIGALHDRTQQDGGSLETHGLSLVCGELSPTLEQSADLRTVGNMATPICDFSLYIAFGLLKEAKLDDWQLECSLFHLDFNGANEAIISWECLDDSTKIPSATG